METAGKKNYLGPPQTIRDEGEELKEIIDGLDLSGIYTLQGLITKLEEVLADVKKLVAFRRFQMLDGENKDD